MRQQRIPFHRIISSSIQSLNQRIDQKKFRQDLFYRLAQVEITIPPLRERPEYIAFLARHFVRKYCIKYNKPNMELSDGALSVLMEHNWPGNVRELQFFCEWAAITKNKGPVQWKDAEALRTQHNNDISGEKMLPLKSARLQFEKNYIIRLLIQNDWNVQKTAKTLGLDRANLYKKLKEHQIDLLK